MKGQIEKVESRSDNVIKLAITVQPENCPVDIMNWRFQMVEVMLRGTESVEGEAPMMDTDMRTRLVAVFKAGLEVLEGKE